MPKNINIQLKPPHSDLQEAMIVHPGTVVSFCGRRWGKTDGYVERLYFWMQQEPGLYWWVGLSWRSASMKRAWREVSKIARAVLRAMGLNPKNHINRSEHEISIPGLGEIWFRTAENPDSLAGEGIRGVILDEFSLMQERVWTEFVQGTLLDYGGWAAFSGVPKGPNWAASLWRSAAEKPGWLQVHATSYDNPFINHAALESIRRDLVEWMFNQEYLAKIVSGEGAVFRNVIEQATAVWQSGPTPGRSYVAGVDVADANDWTVVTVMDVEDKKEVYKDRYRRVGYPVLEDRLHALTKHWELEVLLVEANSIGKPVIDHLQEFDIPVVPFYTTSSTKAPLIQSLQSAFEHREIRILPDETTINELVAFQTKRRAGSPWYGAPPGMHDDTVMSLALAWHALDETGMEVLF